MIFIIIVYYDWITLYVVSIGTSSMTYHFRNLIHTRSFCFFKQKKKYLEYRPFVCFVFPNRNRKNFIFTKLKPAVYT